MTNNIFSVVLKTQAVLYIIGFILIILRAFKLIAWNWWIVTIPFWGPLAIIAVLMVLLFILLALTPLKENE